MKKNIFLTSAMAAALVALPGCSSSDDWDDGSDWNEDIVANDDTAICVDENGNRIDDDACDDNRPRVGGFYAARYYINRGSRLPYYGDSIRDPRYNFSGNSTPKPGANYAKPPSESRITRSAAVARGGFGSSSRGYGGGRS
jgi:hypothetical protein